MTHQSLWRGRYRDTIIMPGGTVGAASPWRPNAIMDGAWALVSALLRNDSQQRGLLYWAVGDGDPAWDAAPPPPDVAATALHHEVARVPLMLNAMTYLDGRGQPSVVPTPTLEVRASLTAEGAPLTLREFGIYGGAATDAPGSGTLVNRVVHPRLDLVAGATLQRRLEFAFRVGVAPVGEEAAPPAEEVPAPVTIVFDPVGDLELADHWLAAQPVQVIAGAADIRAAVFERADALTLGAVAKLDVHTPIEGMAAPTRAWLIGSARLALRAVRRGMDLRRALPGLGTLEDVNLIEATTLPLSELAVRMNADPRALYVLTEHLAPLVVVLNDDLLRKVSLNAMLTPGARV